MNVILGPHAQGGSRLSSLLVIVAFYLRIRNYVAHNYLRHAFKHILDIELK